MSYTKKKLELTFKQYGKSNRPTIVNPAQKNETSASNIREYLYFSGFSEGGKIFHSKNEDTITR